jgi:pimeloyl-ACP methyl ester carboxylesterase
MKAIAAAVLVSLGVVGCAGAQPPSTAAIAAPAFYSERISVRVEGRGPDVVLIPGLSSSPSVWAETVKANPGHRFHLVQLSGFAGAPARGNAQGAVGAESAAEIGRYIEAQRLRRPALIGHSMGGTMAMMVAARHPERVGKVMIVDMLPWIGVFFGAPGSTVEQIRPVADQIRTGMAGPRTPQGEAFLEQTINGMINTTSRRAGVLAESRASDRDVSARAYHELLTTDLRPELAKIAAPVTVLYVKPGGSPLDDAQTEAMYRAMYAGLKGAELKRIPDSAHFIMFDQPERFQAEVREFLAEG